MNCKDCLNMKVKIPFGTTKLFQNTSNPIFLRLLYSSATARCASFYNERFYDYGKADSKEQKEGYKSWQLKEECPGFISMDD